MNGKIGIAELASFQPRTLWGLVESRGFEMVRDS